MMSRSDTHPGFDLRHRSIGLDRDKRVRIVLPTAPCAERKAPLCILLHGFGGNRLAWFAEGGDRVRRMARRCALVLPESGRRWFINDEAGFRYESYLVDELVPELREILPDNVETGHIILGGFSMGGAAAVFLALRYPHLFPTAYSYGGAFFASRRTGDPYATLRDDACMMPLQGEHDRVWGGRGSRTRRTYDPVSLVRESVAKQSLPAAIRLEVGREDYARVLNHNRRMRRVLGAAGIDHSYEEVPGDHSWPAALRAMEQGLECLIGS